MVGGGGYLPWLAMPCLPVCLARLYMYLHGGEVEWCDAAAVAVHSVHVGALGGEQIHARQVAPLRRLERRGEK